ncbi:STAS domain-containing protein [Polyangium jinanense]|uniref:PAS domain-containing protein n=1 Tax=Polyangium jinanense TaxID=2829994 RepID=A0A9X3WZR2_9BACT|nr:STAS domain-containing protein [Polyangium jinanense]MDC3954744.1 PAS domain-containing protein [Polyangium jinanense]MDC3961908.1 PAS domain-containing protein [Polyangium jinanense]MDC3981047.1 PAS domain-containing protein [Polyangium jinanense]
MIGDIHRHLGGVFEGCPDPLLLVEGDVVVAQNEAARAELGEASSLLALFDAADRSVVSSACAAVAGGQSTKSTFSARSAAGTAKRWTAWSVGNGGVCVRMDGPAEPRTDIPAPLAPLLTKDEPVPLRSVLLGKIFDRFEGILWAIAKDGTILVSEGKGLAHFGIAPGALVGMNALQIYPPGSTAREETERALAGEELYSDSIEGMSYWIRRLTPVRDAAGDITSIVGFSLRANENTEETFQAKALIRALSELPLAIWAMDADGTCKMSLGNGLKDLGLKPGELVGKNLYELYSGREDFQADMKRAFSGEQFVSEISHVTSHWRNTIIPVRDTFGDRVVRIYSVAENVTDRVEYQRRLEEHLALIQSQKQAIVGLSSPIIEVWQGVLVVPLIGSIDQARASILLERLLTEVVSRQSSAVILDLTGVDTVDAEAAQHLSNVMRSVELVGATGLLSGIRPSVAKTMVDLGVDMQSRRTYPTLAEALRKLIGARKR